MKKIKFSKNPFILFLPFLFLYGILIIIFATKGNHGDEIRYLTYAKNLSHGFYSPAYPFIDLGNGPGYPLLITPLVALNAPTIFIKLLNALFYYFSIVFLFKALQQIVSYKFSFIFSLIWALYPNIYEQLFSALPEVLAASLIPLFIFSVFKAFQSTDKNKGIKYLILAGFTLGFLILTKPVFGYELIALSVSVLVLWLLNIRKINYKKSLGLLLIAFIINLPYLAYTYNLTGKMFYWSSFGGNNLYWMSTPFEGEYGDWIGFPVSPQEKDKIPGSNSLITARHQKDFDEILKNKEVQKANIQNGQVVYNLTKGVTQDDLFKSIAIQNIKTHPKKYMSNYISNMGRMIFNYPVSYVLQKPSTLRRLPINGTIVVISLFCLFLTLTNWRKVLYPLKFSLVFALLYFGGSALGSADTRMFNLVIPVLLIWIAYIIERAVKINSFSCENG
jgi:hypothetical protein